MLVGLVVLGISIMLSHLEIGCLGRENVWYYILYRVSGCAQRYGVLYHLFSIVLEMMMLTFYNLKYLYYRTSTYDVYSYYKV